MPDDAKLSVEPYFTLVASITQDDVGPIEGGFRVDFSYQYAGEAVDKVERAPRGRVAARKKGAGKKAEAPEAKERHKGPPFSERVIGASLSSGSDWVFVSDEAFIDFDSTITLALKPEGSGCLIGARLTGRADLRDCLNGKTDERIFELGVRSETILEEWQRGLEDAVLPLTLAVTIDIPTKGLNPVQDEIYAECLPLGASLLVGVGKAIFSGDPNGAVEKIELTIGKPSPNGALEGA
jgi:hypothetical protein